MILHLANDYSGSTVYRNLISELDRLGVAQIVYTPVKEVNNIGKNKIDKFRNEKSELIYSHILNKTTDRIFYRLKIKKIVKDIESKIDLEKIKFIHSHTWYSDGGVAYLLHKKYNIPYITTVRNTDVNIFYKFLIHERSFGKKILQKSEQVIFLTPAFKNRLSALSGFSDIEQKIKFIPNGVDRFWIENAVQENPTLRLNPNVQLLYVGKFSATKNIINLIKAVVACNKYHKQQIVLHLVGGGGKFEKKAIQLINEHPTYFKFHGKITDKEKLLSIYKNADLFTMPSNRETFGLVYIEALLMGLPVLYTENEGIDGLYVENIGEKVSKHADSDEIREAILLLIANYRNYILPISSLKENHNWAQIAMMYQEIYP